MPLTQFLTQCGLFTYCPSPSIDLIQPSTNPRNLFSPEDVKPFRKAPTRKAKNKGKTKRTTTIYTETPEKEIIRKNSERNKRGWEQNQSRRSLFCRCYN